jgi:aryl-alcohol dehydrogenase-like predicted oxidoreductase
MQHHESAGSALVATRSSWAQFFLELQIGHPAVTCPIPATRSASHVRDNVQAAFGRIPDAKQRAQMAAALH